MEIYLIDDEPNVRETLKKILETEHEVTVFEKGSALLKALETTAVDLIITDQQMPEITGFELIRKGKIISPNSSFFLITAFGSIDQAVEAIRHGADDYLMKPFDILEFRHRVNRIRDLRAFVRERTLRVETRSSSSKLTGTSEVVEDIRKFIDQVALVPSPILLLGPSGSGKEVVAREIHAKSSRQENPFIAINCATLSEQLMESELFGHEKGAFTGAVASKPGKFELANDGVLFLDEIGELGPSIQAKLLRVLQDREFYRVGGCRIIKTTARIIAATNKDLKEMVTAGKFREDLYFRLNVISFQMPSLKDRKKDIPALIQHFLEKFGREFGKKFVLLPKTMQLLTQYAYPGNIRELQNVIERLAVFGLRTGTIEPEALPPEFLNTQRFDSSNELESGWKPGHSLEKMVDALEYRIISRAMKEALYNRTKAAELLQISRGQLMYKLKRLKIAAVPSDDEVVDEAA